MNNTASNSNVVKVDPKSPTPVKDVLKQLKLNLKQIELTILKSELDTSALMHKKLVIEYEIARNKPVSTRKDKDESLDDLAKL